jgi:hypothetical protein
MGGGAGCSIVVNAMEAARRCFSRKKRVYQLISSVHDADSAKAEKNIKKRHKVQEIA